MIPQQQVGVEAAVVAGVAGAAHLVDFQQHGITVTVESDAFNDN